MERERESKVNPVTTYRNQSTATIMVMSSVGKLTAVKTIIMVTRPAEGTAAAPKLAAVEVNEIMIKSGKLNSIPFICPMKIAATAS